MNYIEVKCTCRAKGYLFYGCHQDYELPTNQSAISLGSRTRVCRQSLITDHQILCIERYVSSCPSRENMLGFNVHI